MSDKKLTLMPRTNSELLEMHKNLVVFLIDGGYQYMDRENYIEVQVPPLKLVEGQTATPTPIITK